jgi:hypothetical protein
MRNLGCMVAILAVGFILIFIIEIFIEPPTFINRPISSHSSIAQSDPSLVSTQPHIVSVAEQGGNEDIPMLLIGVMVLYLIFIRIFMGGVGNTNKIDPYS